MRGAIVFLGLAVSIRSSAHAQGDCFPGKTSHEAKTFAIYSVPLAFSPAGLPRITSGRIQLGLELAYLPNIDSVTATPTVCRPGKGPENTDLLFAAPRPRITVALGGGFALEGSWTPPVRLNQVQANLFAAALSYDTRIGRQAGLTVRLHGSTGTIKAPITCPDKALAVATSECFRGSRSDDSFKPSIVGAEALIHWGSTGGPIHPYLGAGYNHLTPRFQVNFTNAVGDVDRRKVEVNLDRITVFGGVAWATSTRWNLSAELYSAPADAVTGRVAIRVGL